MTPHPLIAGNWKMNGFRGTGVDLAVELGQRLVDLGAAPEIAVCPPFTALGDVAGVLRGSGIQTGGQDCSPLEKGAHTGDISAAMLADAGCTLCIVGHSERRRDHREDDALVRSKAEAAHRAGLSAIVCIGETEQERDAGETIAVVTRQLAGSAPEGARSANCVIAYEPVWAIGTGRTPTLGEIGEVHDRIRTLLIERFGDDGAGFRILYGGSVTPDNAPAILQVGNVNGALVGGASLKAETFWPIVTAAPLPGV